MLAAQNRHLGTLTLRGIPPDKVRAKPIVQKFELDKNGILRVTANCEDASATLQINYNQSNEVDKVLDAAEAHRSADQLEHDRLDAKSILFTAIQVVQYESENVRSRNNHYDA